jgi:hypothetical protein
MVFLCEILEELNPHLYKFHCMQMYVEEVPVQFVISSEGGDLHLDGSHRK